MKVLLVSDVHANAVALEAVLTDAGSFDALWNLGDTVGYGPEPVRCLELLDERGADPTLAGNHDLACVGALALSEFNPVARAAAEWTAKRLGPRHRAFLANLPSLATVAGFTLAHGSPRHPVWEYVIDPATAAASMEAVATSVCFVGHSHLPLVATVPVGHRGATLRPLRDGETIDLARGRHLVNPGSVGQPRDRDARAAYALLDVDRGSLAAHRVTYDVAATQRRMMEASLPVPLIFRLAHGV